jgi:hypothetical protein
VSDDFSRMPFAAEVNAFEAEVSRDKGFVSARQAKNGAVVANAFDGAPRSRS